ncbi:MAG: NUDIX hydrolase [Verrucomicrobiota bacterium]
MRLAKAVSESMHSLIKEIRALAQSALHYTKDPYDRQRFERLIDISSELFTELSDSDLASVERFFIPEVGYATPKVDLRACVFRDEKVMLVRERSDGLWALPGGFADQNESPIEGITREVKEESGFDIVVDALYAIKDRDRNPYQPKYPVSIYKMFFTGSVVGGGPETNIEVSEIDFFSVDSLPPLSEARVLPQDIRDGCKFMKEGGRGCHCD